jgi:hypothetical protein
MWSAVHLGEFAGMALILAGLMVLYFALGLSKGTPRWVGFFGAVSAGVALALAAVAYAVDGVALKQAVDAWTSAPSAEKATRFTDAKTLRWLEWGLRSYLDFVFGLALVLLATAIVWTARIPRPVGYLMGASGLCFVAVGWVFGTEGFAMVGVVPSDAAQAFLLAWIVWLLVVAWRRKGTQAAPA